MPTSDPLVGTPSRVASSNAELRPESPSDSVLPDPAPRDPASPDPGPPDGRRPLKPAQDVPLRFGRHVLLPCVLLLVSMFNLTLIVAGLKEFMLDDLGGTMRDATLFFSVETLAYILFAPLWGLLSDRSGRRRSLVFLGFLISGVIYLLYATVNDIGLLLGLRFVQGMFTVMGWSLVMAMILDRAHGPSSGRYLGLMGAALIFGVAVGAPFGGYLTRWGGPRFPLLVAGGLFLLLALLSLFLDRSPELRRGTSLNEVIKNLSSRPRLLLPCAFHFVDRLAVGLFVVNFPLYLDSMGADDPAVRGRYLGYFLLPFALLQYFSGRLAERSGPIPPLLIGSVLYGGSLTVVGFSGLVALRPVMIALGVFAAVMFPPAMMLTSRWSDSQTRASAIGGFNLAGSLGFAVGPLLGNWVYRRGGFELAFAACGALEIGLAVATAMLVLMWRRQGMVL